MAPVTYNEQAKAALSKQLLAALDKAELTETGLSPWGDNFDAVRKTILKYKGEWLTDIDVAILLDEMILRSLPPSAKFSIGQIRQYLNEIEIQRVADEIATFVGTIPRAYEINFPLPKVQIKAETILSNSVKLIRTFAGPENSLRNFGGALLPSPQPLPDSTYLCVLAKGYFSRYLFQSAMKDGLSMLKRTVQIARLKTVLDRDRSVQQTQLLADALGGNRTEQIHRAFVLDVTNLQSKAAFVQLNLVTSSYLASLTVLNDRAPLPGLMIPRVRAAAQEEDIKRILATPVKLMTEEVSAFENRSLGSALEWAFDADVDDEETSKFLKTCIGLEAVLGEDSDEDRITERIADRCAYLLNEKSGQRAVTRKKMREVYKLRSKVVHGLKTRFSNEDKMLALHGRLFLHQVLSKELEALEK